MNKKEEQRLAAKIAKITAMLCVRNTRLESLHAGRVPVSNTGDFSDVKVVDAAGNEIPWNSVSHIDDNEMKSLMKQIVNRLYTFQIMIEDPAMQRMVDRWTSEAERWDEPEIDGFYVEKVGGVGPQ